MKDSINFKELIKEAKDRVKDPDVLEVLKELEAEPSLQSVVTGTLLTWGLSQEVVIDKNSQPDI